MDNDNYFSANDFSRISEVTPGIGKKVDDLFQYHVWSDAQERSGNQIRNCLIAAYKSILDNAPPCSTRTRALNAILDARMLANAAITHEGRY